MRAVTFEEKFAAYSEARALMGKADFSLFTPETCDICDEIKAFTDEIAALNRAMEETSVLLTWAITPPMDGNVTGSVRTELGKDGE